MKIRTFLSLLVFLCSLTAFADREIYSNPEELSIPIQTSTEIKFQLDKLPAEGHALLLEFNARLDYPLGLGGYNAKGFLPYMNGKLLPVETYLNGPMEFRFLNGHTGEPGRWCPPKVNFENIKTGNMYEDKVLKDGGNYYALTYAKNFVCIDTPENKYSSLECSRSHFQFDVSAYCQEGENVLVLYNAMSPGGVKAMGGSLTNPKNKNGKFPMIVRDVTIKEVDKVPARQETFWLKELEEISKTMPFVEPRTDFSENYSLRFGLGGAVIVKTGDKEYRISTSFSYPGEGKFNHLPGGNNNEAAWVPSVNVKALTVDARGAFYSFHREIDKQPGHFEIRDTLENLTDQPVPVRVRYEVPFLLTEDNCIYNSGLKVDAAVNDFTYYPENPTFFLSTPGGSLGLIPGDDVLRIQTKNYVVKGAAQMRDDQLMLAPGKKVTLRLQVYPVEKGDYCTFINQVRKVWDLNGEAIQGTLRSGVNLPGKNWKPNKGMAAVHVDSRVNNDHVWGLALAENKDVHERSKAIIDAFKKIVPEGVRVFSSYMAIYFSNATGKDLERFGDCVVINKDGKTYPMEANCRFYIPTRDNDFGKMVTNTVDMMIDDWKADGIYFDYLEGADPYFTYNQKDGVSCDIDQKTGNLLAEKGSYQLLSQDYLVWLMKHVADKGVLIHANRNPFTWTTATSIKKETPFRLTECGYPDQLARGHLGFTPLGLQRTFANKLHLQVIRALYEGMLTIPYNVRYQWDDNPVAYTYPIKFRELRRGCVIGENKIVTAISGHFGWGDQSNFKCRIFDKEGHLRTEDGGETITKDGKNYLKLTLNPLEVAVIERI
jgi:hypothetical protein